MNRGTRARCTAPYQLDTDQSFKSASVGRFPDSSSNLLHQLLQYFQYGYRGHDSTYAPLVPLHSPPVSQNIPDCGSGVSACGYRSGSPSFTTSNPNAGTGPWRGCPLFGREQHKLRTHQHIDAPAVVQLPSPLSPLQNHIWIRLLLTQLPQAFQSV